MISTSGHLIPKFPEVRFHRTRIFKVVTGTVTGENGDGQIDYQGYIKYHDDLAVGTRIESVMIYNPNNNYIDDIMYRADTIIE